MYIQRYARWFAFTSVLVFLVACAVPRYDEAADKATTELQQKMEKKFYEWSSLLKYQKRASLKADEAKKVQEKLAYSANMEFYADTRAALDVLQTRLASAETEKVSLTSIDEWFKLLNLIVTNTEAEHESGKLDPIALQFRVRELNPTFMSILTYIQITKPATKK